MALCRYAKGDGSASYALYRPGQICPLESVTSNLPSDDDLFAKGGDWLSSLSEPQEADWISAPEKLLLPVPLPEKIFCIGLNYRDHAIETGAEIPTEPVVFSKFNSTLIGHGESIQLPKVSDRVDYEAELVVVIGRQAKHVAAADALDYVFGYACGHDVSARDWQKGRPGGQWLLGKTFDTFAPIGPCVVSASDVPDPSNLGVRMHLNGEVVQDSTTAQLIFSVPELIEHLSKVVTLRPGDLIFTGTPPGVGDAKTPPVYLKPGDVCTVEIEGVGSLTNDCIAEA